MVLPSMLVFTHPRFIVKLKMDKDRKKIVDRRAKGRAEATGKDKGKYTEETAAATPMNLKSVFNPTCLYLARNKDPWIG